MGKVRRFVEFVHSEALHAVQAAATHDKRPERAGLVGTDHDEMKFAAIAKCIATGLYPCILVHRTVGILGKQPPALRFIVDNAEFLNNPDGRAHGLGIARRIPLTGYRVLCVAKTTRPEEQRPSLRGDQHEQGR
jgi:hypothetical protein